MWAWLRSFLEESPGVNSSTRLIALTLTGYAGVVVWAVVWYLHHADRPEAAVIGALAVVLGALVLNGIVAIVKRNGGTD